VANKIIDEDPAYLQGILDTYHRLKSYRSTGEVLGMCKDSIRRRVAFALSKGMVPAEFTASPSIIDETKGRERIVSAKGRIRSVEDLLHAANVDLDNWTISRQVVNKWDALVRVDDGTTAVEPMFQIKVFLERRLHHFISIVEPIEALPRKAPPRNQADQTMLVLPDAQFGFRRKGDKLIPFHDRVALDLALKACAILKPDVLVLMGDWLDFPELSRFTTEPECRYLIQPALIELAWWLQAFMRTAPDHCEAHWVEGNHEFRLRNSLLEHQAGALADITPIGEDLQAQGAPALSVERLLCLDKLGIQYHAPYGKPLWLWGNIMVHHGHVVRSGGGKTVSSILAANSTQCHQIVGHIHRREVCSKTVLKTGGDGYQTFTAMSNGCLCSLTPGVVPAGRGRPGVDWQHGLGVVYKTKDSVHLHSIPIENGVAVIEGQIIKGSPDLGEIKKATGLSL